MSDIDALGIARMNITMPVQIVEMKDWEPRRIERFFNGIAVMIRAANNTLPQMKLSARREGLMPMRRPSANSGD